MKLSNTHKHLVVFCADVGSVKQGNFGWAASYPPYSSTSMKSGSDIKEFAEEIANQIKDSKKVAIGFECPLFVPVRDNPNDITSARNGEGNRSWSASAGACALTTGLVEVLWVMNKISKILGFHPKVTYSWNEFTNDPCSVFIWEAFVTSTAKGDGHAADAEIAVNKFIASLPNPEDHNAIKEKKVLSLVGAAALRAGWSHNTEIISQPCLVIKA